MAGYASTGTILMISNGASPPVFNHTYQVVGLTELMKERNRIDTDTHNSAFETGWIGQFILGAKKAGSVTVRVLYDPGNTTHYGHAKSLEGLFDSGEKVEMKFRHPTSPVMYDHFTAAVSSWKITNEMEAATEGEATLQIEGRVVSNP